MTKNLTGLWVLAGLAVLALVTPACGVKAPILALDGVKVGDMGITGVALDVRFRLRNPNPEPLQVDKMEYELFINGNRVGRGFDSKGLLLEGFGEGKVAVFRAGFGHGAGDEVHRGFVDNPGRGGALPLDPAAQVI